MHRITRSITDPNKKVAFQKFYRKNVSEAITEELENVEVEPII